MMCIIPVLLVRTFVSLRHRKVSVSMASLWSIGVGNLTDYTFLYIGLPTADPFGLISNILIANGPQVLISLFYMTYNNMLTTFLVQREFSRMCRTRKTLRVSEPLGDQRSSYPISLPFRYGLPLQASSAAMNWLISQALFLARITALNPDGSVDRANSFSTCGYSSIAMIISESLRLLLIHYNSPRSHIRRALVLTLSIACFVLGLMVLYILCLSRLKYDGPMPIVSTNSRAISAACHVPPNDVKEGYLKPLGWGVVWAKNGLVHCSFTTAQVREPYEKESDGIPSQDDLRTLCCYAQQGTQAANGELVTKTHPEPDSPNNPQISHTTRRRSGTDYLGKCQAALFPCGRIHFQRDQD